MACTSLKKRGSQFGSILDSVKNIYIKTHKKLTKLNVCFYLYVKKNLHSFSLTYNSVKDRFLVYFLLRNNL